MALTEVNRNGVLRGRSMEFQVILSKGAKKDLRKAPRYILRLFEFWVNTIEEDGYLGMQKVRGYRDHALQGNRWGQRSSSLTRGWRVIYVLDEENSLLKVEVLEVNNHDY